jgi:hypothetical protein
VRFIADLEPNDEDSGLQIMYGIDGTRDLTESTRDELSGHAEARPVRVGNAAFNQRQNHVFGAAWTRSSSTHCTQGAWREGCGRSSSHSKNLTITQFGRRRFTHLGATLSRTDGDPPPRNRRPKSLEWECRRVAIRLEASVAPDKAPLSVHPGRRFSRELEHRRHWQRT